MFSFFQKKVCLILLTGLLVVSCSDPTTVTVTGNENITIYSQTDMAKIGAAETHPLTGNYLLANDITLEDWPPIGDEAKPFAGVFNGNGKKITLNSFAAAAVSGKTYLGVFGYVKGKSASARAAIKNLTIQSSVDAVSTMASGQAVGLVTGYAELAVIENITLTGIFAFKSEKTIFAGGAAGFISEERTLVKNSKSSLTMNIVPGSGGGLAGGVGYNYVGGFVGMFRNGAGIENCHNSGDVIADNTANAVSGQVFAGGIAGGSFHAINTNYHGYITDSSSGGTIIGRAKGNWTFAGGIAGTIVGGDGTPAHITRIERCFAAGTVSVAGTDSGFPYVGGIVGYNYYGALVSQCYFDGAVIADKSGDYTGGIAGYNSQAADHNSRIEDCWSSGTVTGFNNSGGIVGQNQINTYVRRSYSTAVISTTNSADTGVGGITGMNMSTMDGGAITACVALNPSLSSPAGNNIYRITGTADGNSSNNHAWSGMTVTTGGTYTADIGPAAADGADCEEKPNQAFYEGLGWDFDNIWKMGIDGYPQLMWQ